MQAPGTHEDFFHALSMDVSYSPIGETTNLHSNSGHMSNTLEHEVCFRTLALRQASEQAVDDEASHYESMTIDLNTQT